MDASIANTTMVAARTASVSPYLNTVAPQAILLQVLCIISLVLDFPCFIWHMGNRNLPAILMVGWVMAHNLYSVANTFIWPIDDVSTYWHGVGYCDVMTKFDMAGQFSKVACALCIIRALAKALDTNRPMVNGRSGAALTRERLLEGTLCIFLPILYGLMQFVVSDRRYYITSISGCEYSFDYTWAAIPLVYIWLPILCYVACYYAVLIIIRLHRYRRDFASVLASTNSGLSKARFLRLLGLAGVFLIAYLPYSTYALFTSIQPPYLDFSWSRIHNPETWQTVFLYESLGQVDSNRWIKVSEGFVVFGAFGFGKDMNVVYSRILSTIGVSQVFKSINSSFNPRSDSDATTLRKPSVFSYKSTTSTLKGRARHIFSKLSVTSSVSSRQSRDIDGHMPSPVFDKLAFPADVRTNSHSHSLSGVQSALGPVISSKIRPTGLAEKALYDDDETFGLSSPAPTVVSTAATLVVPHNYEVSHTSDAHLYDRPQVPLPPPHHHSQSFLLHQPSRPAASSKLWTRMQNYVSAMGPRSAANMGATGLRGPGQMASGATSAGRNGNGTTDLEMMQTREYEAHVVNRLA